MIPLWLDAHDRAFAQIISETNNQPIRPSTLLLRLCELLEEQPVNGLNMVYEQRQKIADLEAHLQFRIVQNGELALAVMRATMNK